jgi:hypothetical protein
MILRCIRRAQIHDVNAGRKYMALMRGVNVRNDMEGLVERNQKMKIENCGEGFYPSPLLYKAF